MAPTHENREDVRPELIDPDPIAVAALCISAASFTLQFIEFWRRKPDTAPPTIRIDASLESLETSTEEALQEIEHTLRVIDRRAEDPDRQFYDARFRVSRVSMEFDPDGYQSYSQRLAALFQKVGAVNLFVAGIITNNAGAAYAIGEKLAQRLEQTADTLNRLIADGGPTREFVHEAKRALQNMREVVTELLSRRGRN